MPDLRVDPLLSYARRARDEVQVVVEVEGEPPVGSDVALRLRGDGAVDQPVTVTPGGPGRFRVKAQIPADRLGEGTWRMKLVDPEHPEPRGLQTRLLLRSGMPIALLPGPTPRTLLPEPERLARSSRTSRSA